MTAAPFPERDRLSLCMIVRNEERALARALESARPWAGELVVVDTGSTDGTVAIARAFGATVVSFPWTDDFSAARNASLEAAGREWALVLDADEVLVVEDAAALGQALRQADVDGFSLPCHNMLDDGSVGRSMTFRLFRRTRPGMRYRGALHEQVSAVADGLVATAVLPGVHLAHDGYTAAVRTAKGKDRRNLTLARRLVADRPDDPHAWFALGQSLHGGDLAEMVQAYERAVSLLAPDARDLFVLQLHYALAIGHHLRGQPDKALAAAERGVALFPSSPDLRFTRGQLRVAQGDPAGAAEDFAACLTSEAAACPLILEPQHAGCRAQTALAAAWQQSGRNVEAEAMLVGAVEAAPAAYAEPRLMLGSLYMQRGAWAEALPLFSHVLALDPAHGPTRFNVGWCLAKLERYDEAEDVLRPIAERPDAAHLLGKVLLEAGKGDEALATLVACPLPAAGLARGWASYVLDRPTEAAACWDDWLRAGAADWGTKDTLAMFLFLLQGGRRPSGQPERPAEPLRDMDLWFRLLLRYQRFEDVEQAIRRGPELGERLWKPLRKRWGITLAKEGFVDVGLSLLLEAREAAPEDAEVYYWLGYCSLHKQHVEEAKVLWETCLRFAPDHPLAAQGLSLLR